MRRTITLALALAFPAAALAQVATTSTSTVPSIDMTDTVGLVRAISEAFVTGDRMLAAGLGITLLVGLFKMLGLNKLIPKQHTKWVAGAIAMALSIAGGLMTHASVWEIVTTGVGVGVIAVGGWEAFLQPVRDWLKSKLGGDVSSPSA